MAPLYAILFVSSMAVINVPGAQSSTSSSPTGTPGYIGCYRDGNPRIMGIQRYGSAADMTAEACSILCDGYDYFGTQHGNQCFCGDASTEFDIYCGDTNCDDVVCDMPCAGDSDEICGGRWAMSVYETTTIDLDYSKLGCAEDPNPGPDGGRLLSVGPFQADPMSAEICYGICGEELPGFEYFGTQWSRECFCATTLRDEVSFDPEHDGCDYTCAGSTDDEICGGRDAVTVYQIDEVVEPEIYSELGCAEDPNPGPDGGRLLSVGPFQADTMSAEICYGICGEELPGFEYFGTQWSSECFCATALRDEVSFDPEHDGCDYTCAGSTDDEICGGRDAVTVYQVEDVVEPPNIYEEVGCAEDPNPGDDGGRLMPVGPIQRDTMSAEICYGLCEEELPGFTYFGTQWSIECWCSQDRPNVSSDPSHDGCIDVCAGSTDGEICGGTDALTIYYVIGSE